MDIAELQQVINKASNVVGDTQALPGTTKRRSFALDEWTSYDKVCSVSCVSVVMVCLH